MFSPEDACRILKAEGLFPDPSAPITGASQDTRTLQPGHLFIALAGAQQDGHEFLEEAFQRGAGAALIRKSFWLEQQERLLKQSGRLKNLILVPDPEKALGQLAVWRRSLFSGPVLGITGSVGKTSTKEMMGYLLNKRWKGLATVGNLNNQLGLPMTLTGLDPAHEFCLAELGASQPGDIRQLTDFLKPTHGAITQIAACHLGGFGSLEAIYETKLELAQGLSEEGTLLLPDFDPVLISKARRFNRKMVLVGETAGADYRVSEVRTEKDHVVFQLAGRREYRVPARAAFFAMNASMAAAMADCLGFRLEDQPPVWDDFKLPAGRFETRQVGDGLTVIYDGYNASPASFERSLEAFSRLPSSGRKAVVFADMLELGPEEKRFHRELGQKIAQYSFDFVGGYGRLTGEALTAVRDGRKGGEVRGFESAEEAGSYLLDYLKRGDLLLLKASRGMRIEKVFKILNEAKPAARGE